MNAGPEVMLAASALATMQEAGRDSLPRETGGILVGFRTRDTVVVTRALTVPDPSSTTVTYELRRENAEPALDDVREGAAGVVGYVGDWHTHPRDLPPSVLDLATFERTAAKAGDLVVLVVLPFSGQQARPPYVRVARPPGRCWPAGRRTPTPHAVAASILESPAEILERDAQVALDAQAPAVT